MANVHVEEHEVMVQIKARLDPRCRLEVAVGD